MSGFRTRILFFVFAVAFGGCGTGGDQASTNDTTADAEDVGTGDTPSTPDADSSTDSSTTISSDILALAVCDFLVDR